jgi:hypothetical protein
MTRMHGKDVRVYLGERDISCDLMSVSPSAMADTHDVTTFCSGEWREFGAGVLGWEASFEGFYQPQAAGFGRQMETALGSDTAGLGVLSIFDGDADAVGDSGILGSQAVVDKRGQPITVSDFIKLSGNLKGNGRLGLFAKLLHPHGQDTVSTNGTALDNSASTAFGGRGNLHITAITGTWTIKVQHSADNMTWADLITFTQATAIGGQTSAVTGTVDRYLRVTSTEDVAGSITFVAGFARYPN